MVTVQHPVSFSDLSLDTVEEFRSLLLGTSMASGENGYLEAKTHRNGMIDRAPGLIIRCQGSSDVMAAVNFARDNGLLISVHGGGHNVAGNSLNDGGIVVDLSAMRGVRVDPTDGTIWAQGGATWADVDREAQIFGLAVPGGVVSTTGIGGLTLHGGLGHLRRKYGLSIDSLLAVDIVTADGLLLQASASENTDLFWAVRGAGSNFGVVTGFKFQGHRVGPTVPVAAVIYSADEAATVITGFRDYTSSAPDDVSTLCVPWRVPEDPHFPEELCGAPGVIVAGVWSGPESEGETALAPLKSLGTVLLDLSGPWPWTALQSGFDALFPIGRRYYWKSTFIDDFSDDAIAVAAERYLDRPGELSDITIWHLGGAIGRVDPSSTSYYRRQAPYLITAEASWDDASLDDAHVTWARETLRRLEPFTMGGGYINFAGFGEEEEALLRSAFGPNYERLVEVKTKYDPDNLFRMNLNIPPNG